MNQLYNPGILVIMGAVLLIGAGTSIEIAIQVLSRAISGNDNPSKFRRILARIVNFPFAVAYAVAAGGLLAIGIVMFRPMIGF